MSESLFKECESLQSTGLDLLNKDIKLLIKKAFKELTDFKEVHERLRKEWPSLKEQRSNPIPPNQRVRFDKQIKKWSEDDSCFVKTVGSNAVLSRVQTQTCVAVTGSFGMGKTAIIRHVALQMRLKGYEFNVVPVTDPWEVEKYNHPVEKNLFVVDNFCGIYDLDEEKLKAWNNCFVQFNENCKLLVSCKLQVYRAICHATLKNIAFHECNLLSKNICLSKNERQSIAGKYDINTNQIIDCLELFDCFPLLCTYHTQGSMSHTKNFFQNPFEVFETKFKMLQNLGANGKVCALMTLLMFNDHVPEVLFTRDINWDEKYILSNTRKACKLNKENAYVTLHKEFENLIGTYIMKEDGVYHARNERIFNFILKYFGQEMTEPLVKYSCSSFVKERFQLSNPSTNKNDYQISIRDSDGSDDSSLLIDCYKWDKVGPNAIILSSENYRNLYVTRILKSWSKGQVNDVFDNPNLYHVFVFKYLIKLDKIELMQYLNKTDINDGSTSIIAYCRKNRASGNGFLKLLIRNGCSINKTNKKGETAIFHSSSSGSLTNVKYLNSHQANTNICTKEGYSPLFMACRNGHIEIVKLLILSGADCNKITKYGDLPLHEACLGGFTSIVTELLDHYSNVNAKNSIGLTSLFLACGYGHSKVVKCLLQSGANCNESTENGNTSLHVACLYGYASIVTELLHYNADVRIENKTGHTPLHLARLIGHHDIQEILRYS